MHQKHSKDDLEGEVRGSAARAFKCAMTKDHRSPSILTQLPHVSTRNLLICSCVLRKSSILSLAFRTLLMRISEPNHQAMARHVWQVWEETGRTRSSRFHLRETTPPHARTSQLALVREYRRAFLFQVSDDDDSEVPFSPMRFCFCGDSLIGFKHQPSEKNRSNINTWRALHICSRQMFLKQEAMKLRNGGHLSMYVQYKRAISQRALVDQIRREKKGKSTSTVVQQEQRLKRIVDQTYPFSDSKGNKFILPSLRSFRPNLVSHLLTFDLPFSFATFPLDTATLYFPSGLNMRRQLGYAVGGALRKLPSNDASLISWGSPKGAFVCTDCEKSYQREFSLKKHIKNKHAVSQGAGSPAVAAVAGLAAIATDENSDRDHADDDSDDAVDHDTD
jgi:hypothetical protein